MTWSRSLLLFALFAAVRLSPALAADVPKDEAAFTAYMQNKLQLYSPAPIHVVDTLLLSVGASNAAVRLPSLIPLHRHCLAAPAKCDSAINDYVQNAAREFLQQPSPTAGTAQASPSTVATVKPSCTLVDGPNANPRDTCTVAQVDWQHSPRPSGPRGTCRDGVVIVSFGIHADGLVSDAAVYLSSDIKILDDTAVAQIAARHYFPATKNGTPVDTLPKAMKSTFHFSCSEYGTLAVAKPFSPEKPSCLEIDGPTADPRDTCTPARVDWHHTLQVPFHFEPTRGGDLRDAIVDFTVHADGSVSDVAVTQSSGFNTFDASAVAMFAARHYFPAAKNGTPVDVRMRRAVGSCILSACEPQEPSLPPSNPSK